MDEILDVISNLPDDDFSDFEDLEFDEDYDDDTLREEGEGDIDGECTELSGLGGWTTS